MAAQFSSSKIRPHVPSLFFSSLRHRLSIAVIWGPRLPNKSSSAVRSLKVSKTFGGSALIGIWTEKSGKMVLKSHFFQKFTILYSCHYNLWFVFFNPLLLFYVIKSLKIDNSGLVHSRAAGYIGLSYTNMDFKKIVISKSLEKHLTYTIKLGWVWVRANVSWCGGRDAYKRNHRKSLRLKCWKCPRQWL